MMDVESLAKELILKNMTPEQQLAVLDSVKASVAQAKEVQKRKIGENVDLVVQALKKIESDIRSRYDDLGNAIEKRVASIKDGRDGINGKDGRDGKDGRNGRDGAKGDKGERGQDGRDGSNGVDGVSVTSARIDFDGSLVITLSSGVELNVGEVVAPDLAERIKVITNGGGTSQSVLDTLSSLQSQINNLIPSQTGNSGKFLTTNGSALSWGSVVGGLSYQGTWNASTNTPTLASSTGTNGYYYIVATAGSTNLNGITDWKVGDWLMFNGSVWQKIDQSETLQTVTSADGSLTVSTVGSNVDLSVARATNVVCQVRNTTGATLTKGTAVYISGATGQIPIVTKAKADSDSSSAQTLGLMSDDLANNTNGYVTVIGLITDIDTSAYTDGAQLYLSGTTAGALTATKTYAPTHLVYVAVVEHAHPTQGKLFVKVQNGYEMDELHNVSAQSPSNGQTLIYNTTTSLWEKANLTAGTGISVSNGAGSITINNTGVTSVTATSPVASSGGTTPAISLSAGYGDTLNPFASKTANYVLAAPNGSAGVPTFRAIVAADIPTLNQNTTGSAATLTTARAIYGNNFDGSAALTQVIASTYGGTGNGFTKFSGPLTTEKTFTLPNASATVLTDNAAVTVLQGGTGATTASGARTNLGLVIGTDVLAPTGSAANLTSFPTLNQNTTGSAASLSATLVATSGGTGQSSYAVGDLLYASTTTALSKLADVATGNALISGGVSTAPSWGKVGLTTHVSGTLPQANGGTGVTTLPAFSATPTTTQSVTTATYTKVNLGTENFDTNNNFASSRFTPTIAGYYFISGSIYSVSSSAATYIWAMVYKNGGFALAGNLNSPVSTVDGVGTVNGLLYMNGSTDYIEMYCYLAGTSPVIQTGANTVFSAFLARGA